MLHNFSEFNVVTIVLFSNACITAFQTLLTVSKKRDDSRKCCGQSFRYHVAISLSTIAAGLGFIYAQFFSPIPMTEQVWSFIAMMFGFQYMMNAKYIHHSAGNGTEDNKLLRKTDTNENIPRS